MVNTTPRVVRLLVFERSLKWLRGDLMKERRTLSHAWHNLESFLERNLDHDGSGGEYPRSQSSTCFIQSRSVVSHLRAPAIILPSRNAIIPRPWRVRRFTTRIVPSPTERKTIYALPVPPGGACGIGVIRVSGLDALDVYPPMVRARARGGAKGKHKELAPEQLRMWRCTIVHPKSQEVLDEGMAVSCRWCSTGLISRPELG